MAKEFFWPASVSWRIPGDVAGVSGGIIYPTRVGLHTLMRRNIDGKYPYMARRLLDPQLYLVGLNPNTCRKKCTYLATYPWFPTTPFTPYNSEVHTQRDWQEELRNNIQNIWLGELPQSPEEIGQAVNSCLMLQESLSCECFILPSPLTVDLNTDYSTELQWLESGLNMGRSINENRPVLATIAISDCALRSVDPWGNELIDLIIDQVSAREPEGVYIVLEQSNEQGYYCTHHYTIGSLLRLVHGLKIAGLKRVVVACAGTAGYLSLLAGADTWSAGWYKAERKLRLTDLEDTSGTPRAYPTYYSHNFASEFHVESDLDRACDNGLLPRILEHSAASGPLLDALHAGLNAANVPEWESRPANVTASKEHFVEVAVNRTAEITDLSQEALFAYGLEWLGNAEILANQMSSIPGRHPRTEINHQSSWHGIFSNFVNMVS